MLPKFRPLEPKPLRQVGHVIAISSAKGGVGKSTLAANLAVSMGILGRRVGLLDVDIFGPSIPRLMNLSGEPRMRDKFMLPLKNHGISVMSMGFLVEERAPIVWRGLMVNKAINQMLYEVEWGGLDVLVVDMPPGTGDIPLTISQQVKLSGAVIVSTPQQIALGDAIKGLGMYRKMGVPILGLVQNMSVFVCPKCHEKSHIFGYEGVKRAAEDEKIELLGDLPLMREICDSSDNGRPLIIEDPEGEAALAYKDIAVRLLEKLK